MLDPCTLTLTLSSFSVLWRGSSSLRVLAEELRTAEVDKAAFHQIVLDVFERRHLDAASDLLISCVAKRKCTCGAVGSRPDNGQCRFEHTKHAVETRADGGGSKHPLLCTLRLSRMSASLPFSEAKREAQYRLQRKLWKLYKEAKQATRAIDLLDLMQAVLAHKHGASVGRIYLTPRFGQQPLLVRAMLFHIAGYPGAAEGPGSGQLATDAAERNPTAGEIQVLIATGFPECRTTASMKKGALLWHTCAYNLLCFSSSTPSACSSTSTSPSKPSRAPTLSEHSALFEPPATLLEVCFFRAANRKHKGGGGQETELEQDVCWKQRSCKGWGSRGVRYRAGFPPLTVGWPMLVLLAGITGPLEPAIKPAAESRSRELGRV